MAKNEQSYCQYIFSLTLIILIKMPTAQKGRRFRNKLRLALIKVKEVT